MAGDQKDPCEATGARQWLPALALVFVILLIVALPLIQIRFLIGPRTCQTLVLQGAVLVFGAVFLPVALLRRPIRFNLIDCLVVAWSLLNAVTGAAGVHPWNSFLDGALLWCFVVLYFIVRLIQPDERDARILLGAFALPATAVAAYAFAQRFGAEVFEYAGGNRGGKAMVVSFLGNPNYVASYLAPLVLVFGGLAATMRRWGALVFGVVSFCCAGALFLTGGRSAMLGLCAGVLVLTALVSRITSVRMRRVVLWVAGAVAVLLLLFAAVSHFAGYDYFRSFTNTRTVQIRLLHWRMAGLVIADNPLLGVGRGNLPLVMDEHVFAFFADNSADEHVNAMRDLEGARMLHVHNEYLQMAAEIGVVGGILFCATIIAAFVRGARVVCAATAASRQRRITAAACAALAVIAVDAFWSFPTILPSSGMLFWMLLAVLASTGVAGEIPNRRFAGVVRAAAAVLATAVCCVHAWVTYTSGRMIYRRVFFDANAQIVVNNDGAAEDLLDAIAWTPGLYEPSPFLPVDAAMVKKRWDVALARMDELASRINLGAEGWFQRGNILFKLRRTEEAEAAFERAHVLNPGSAAFLEYLAFSEASQGKPDEALEHAEAALVVRAESANAHYMLGLLKEKTDRRAAAEHFESALDLAGQAKGPLFFTLEGLRMRIDSLE